MSPRRCRPSRSSSFASACGPAACTFEPPPGAAPRFFGDRHDDTLRNLVEAGTSAVCIVAKSSAYHVTEALQTTLAEGEAMIADSVRFLRDSGRRVLVDMEHFFDGYK